MENKTIKEEGVVYELDKELNNDQITLEVSDNIESTKIEKEDKQSFESFKELYSGVIDIKCMQDYGTCDDKKLWEDIAKELFLRVSTYVPQETDKVQGELDQKFESKELSRK